MKSTLRQIQVPPYCPQHAQTEVPHVSPPSVEFLDDTERLDTYGQVYAPEQTGAHPPYDHAVPPQDIRTPGTQPNHQPAVSRHGSTIEEFNLCGETEQTGKHPSYSHIAPFQDPSTLDIQSDRQDSVYRHPSATQGSNLCGQVYQPKQQGAHISYNHVAPFQDFRTVGIQSNRQAFNDRFVDTQTGRGVSAIVPADQWAWSHPSHSGGPPQALVETTWYPEPFLSASYQNSESSSDVAAFSEFEPLDFLNSQEYAELFKGQDLDRSFLPAVPCTTGYGEVRHYPGLYPTVDASGNPHHSPYSSESLFPGSDAFWSNKSSPWTRDNARHGILDGSSYDPSDMTTSQTAFIQHMTSEPPGARVYGLDSDPPQGSTSGHTTKHLSHGMKMSWPSSTATSTDPAKGAFVRLVHLPLENSLLSADQTTAAACTSQANANPVASIRPTTPDQLAPADLGPVKARLSKGFYSNQSQEQLWGSKICPYDHIDRGKCRGIMSDEHFVRSHVKKEGVLWEKNGFKKDKLAKRHRSWIIHNQDMALRVAKSLYPCGVEDCNKTFARDQVAWVHRRSQHPKAPPIQSDRSDAESEVQLLQWIGRQS